MVKAVDCSDFRSSSPATELQRITFSIQCSAPKSKWAAKWTSLSLVSKFSKPEIPAVSASLKAKLPGIVLKLGLAVRISVGKGRAAPTVQKTVKFFGMFKARKFCFRLRCCFRKLRAKTFSQAGSGSGGGIWHRDVDSVQSRKLNELAKEEQRKVAFDKSPSELATWVSASRRYWQGQVTALLGWLGNSSMLFHFFASEKERWAMVARAGVVLSTLLVLLSQLGTAVAVPSAAFIASASAVVVGSVLNFCRDKNRLTNVPWKLWKKPITVRGMTCSP